MNTGKEHIKKLCGALDFALYAADKNLQIDGDTREGLCHARLVLSDAEEHLAKRDAFCKGFYRGFCLYIPDLIKRMQRK